jgi:hypothetical protein
MPSPLSRGPRPPLEWRPTKIMNVRDLSKDDDFLSHLLIEKLGTSDVPLVVHKMDPSRRLPKTDAKDLLAIVRRVRLVSAACPPSNAHLTAPPSSSSPSRPSKPLSARLSTICLGTCLRCPPSTHPLTSSFPPVSCPSAITSNHTTNSRSTRLLRLSLPISLPPLS